LSEGVLVLRASQFCSEAKELSLPTPFWHLVGHISVIPVAELSRSDEMLFP